MFYPALRTNFHHGCGLRIWVPFGQLLCPSKICRGTACWLSFRRSNFTGSGSGFEPRTFRFGTQCSKVFNGQKSWPKGTQDSLLCVVHHNLFSCSLKFLTIRHEECTVQLCVCVGGGGGLYASVCVYGICENYRRQTGKRWGSNNKKSSFVPDIVVDQNLPRLGL